MRVHIDGDAAVLSARSVGTVQAGSQTIKVDERTTDMYARPGGRWRLVAGHTSDIPAERTAAKIDAKIYDLYVGEYQLTPSVTLLITNEGGRLMTQAVSQGKPSGPKSELLPRRRRRSSLRARRGRWSSSGLTGAGSPTWSSAGAGRRFRSRRSNERPDAYADRRSLGEGWSWLTFCHRL